MATIDMFVNSGLTSPYYKLYLLLLSDMQGGAIRVGFGEELPNALFTMERETLSPTKVCSPCLLSVCGSEWIKQ